MEYDENADLDRHRSEVEGLFELLDYLNWGLPPRRLALDIGGGDGLHASWLLDRTEKLIVSDIKNYLGDSDGLHAARIKDKLQNIKPLDLSRVEFQYVDAHNVPYKDGLVDLAVSINAFEHIPDPDKALDEIIRVVEPGGLVMLQFDPLWHSPFGHHLWHLGMEPWAHLLISDAEFENEILAHGGTEDDISVFRTGMNRKTFQHFKKMFTQVNSKFSNVYFNYWARTEEEEPNVIHENFQRCLDAGYDREDLMVRGVQFLGVVRA